MRRPRGFAGVPDASVAALLHPERTAAFAGHDPALPLDCSPASWPARAAWLAQASHLAYHPPERIAATWARLGFALAATLEAEGVRAHLAAVRGVAILAFCGTRPDEPRNLRDDLDAVLVPWEPGGRAHRGFARALNALRPALDAALAGLPPALPVIATGHSLGGALACLASTCLPFAAVTVFGAPRVGDDALVARLPAQLERWQNCCDVVGHLPVHEAGWRHGGRLHYLARHGACWREPTRWRMRRDQLAAGMRYACALPWARRGMLPARSLADHSPINYVARLRRLPRC